MVELTKKEEESIRYCEDFCPLYQSLYDYNLYHMYTISCDTKMCERVKEAYILNLREAAKSALAEKGGAE